MVAATGGNKRRAGAVALGQREAQRAAKDQARAGGGCVGRGEVRAGADAGWPPLPFCGL